MDFIIDTHTHTLASGHSYSTIREMAHMASKKGLQLLGITEHAPKMPGTCHEYYFQNLKVVDRQMCGVELLLGAELNIMNPSGEVDLPEKTLRQMDLTIASLHVPCMAPGTRLENTSAYINAMKNPLVNIIGHPDDRRYPVDYLAIVQAAQETHTLLELNNSSLTANGARKDARPLDKELLSLCMQYSVPIIVGSDAHVDTAVGNHELAEALLMELDFPSALVLNSSTEAFQSYVNRYKF